MELQCSVCGGSITDQDIDLERCVAKCPSCDAMFMVQYSGDAAAESDTTNHYGAAADVNAAATPDEAAYPATSSTGDAAEGEFGAGENPYPDTYTSARSGGTTGVELAGSSRRAAEDTSVAPNFRSQRSLIASPDTVRLEEHGQEAVLLYKWPKVGMAAGTAVFGIGLVVAVWGLLHRFPIALRLVAEIPVVLFALAAGYAALADFFNHTHFRIAGQQLEVSHDPIPWAGSARYAKHQVRQLYVKEAARAGRRRTNRAYYSLHAILRDGRHIRLLGGISSAYDALYLEQQMEARLDIADKAVPGEMAGKMAT